MIAYLPPLVPPNRRPEDLVLRVDEVSGRYDRGRFASLGHQLYRGDRRWAPPLSAERRDALRVQRNPLLSGGQLSAFLGIAQNLGLGDEVVGSIAAWSPQVDAEAEEEAWGSWGLFESINVAEMAERLFSEAETWLFEHVPGMGGISGPMTLEPLASPGLLTDGFDQDPVAFLPYNPPYYPEMVEAEGYERGITWRAYLLETGAHESDTQIRAPDQWLHIFSAYSNHAQPPLDQPPLTPHLVEWLGYLAGAREGYWTADWRGMMNVAARRAIFVYRAPERAPKAAVFGIPDLAPALRRARGRLFPFGWLAFRLAVMRTQRLRAFPAAAPATWGAEGLAELYEDLMRRAAQAGYRQMIVAPVGDDDERSIDALVRLHARPIQQFTLYEKRF